MTREEIMAADAPALRLLAAEHVMGHPAPFVLRPVPCPDGLGGCAVLHCDWFDAAGARLPAYSSEIAAAWQVVESVAARSAHAHLSHESGRWAFYVAAKEQGPWWEATSEAAPPAICRAALLARFGRGDE